MTYFVSLHHHSTFSYLDGFGQPEEHVAAVTELGMPALALTEHGNVTSHVKLEQACKAADIKPIFGCELYTGGIGEDRSRFKWHLTVLAQNQIGYRNLLRMVSEGWEKGFYYEPTVDWDNLVEHQEGLIVLSGCSGSKVACDLLGGKGVDPHDADYKSARRTVRIFRDLLGDRFYLEAQAFPELDRTRDINSAYAQLSKDLKIPLVATGDVHYPRPDDNQMQILLHAIDRGGKNNTFEKQQQSWGYDIRLAPLEDNVIWRRLKGTGLTGREAEAAVRETGAVADRIDVELPKLKELQFPTTQPREQLLRALIRQGWQYRGFDRLPKEERRRYSKRIKYEVGLIEKLGFVDYFLVVGEMVRWSKDNQIGVGPARGSAAASLACYCLRITEVNPMFFPNLLFERFIDINRHDLPDIDLDFDDEQRYRVRDHAVELYGEERVGNIGTFTQFRGKNSLTDVAKVHRVPYGAVESVKEMLIERASGDLRGNATIEDTVDYFPKVRQVFEQYPVLYQAQRLEGNLRGMSVHAAGLVVANEPLTNSVAVYSRRDQKTGEIVGNVLSIDKHDAEYINALKIDVLGLTTMGVIGRCLRMIGMTLEELYAVPLDDDRVFDAFKRNEVIGIFQFDGRAMRSVNREVKPDNFAEVCDINALARPGPLHSGAAAEYIMVKHGKKKAQFLHSVVSEITAHTNQQIVYQEQILQTVRRLGGFSWEEAALIRKLISKKQGEQAFNRMQQRFLEGCSENGLKEGVALQIWKQLVTAGAYAFNAAHCVSYGMLAYWTMWLKVNHPLEFYCAALQKYDPKTKGFDLLKEAAGKGITILPPDPAVSGESWIIESGGLRAGFLQVNGIGEVTAAAILDHRDQFYSEGIPMEWTNLIEVRGIGKVTIGKIQEFAEDPDPFGINLLGSTLARVRMHLWHQGEALGLPFPRHKADDVPYEPARGEFIWLGMVRDRNLKDLYELHRSRTGEELNPASVKEPEFVNWMVITGEDETGPLVITIHRYGGFYEKMKDRLWEMDIKNQLLLVVGHKRNEYRRAIYASQIFVIDPLSMTAPLEEQDY